jgi:hypothetical protein
MWVGDAAPTRALLSSRQGKVSSVASPSSFGLEEGAFVTSSVATRSAYAATTSDAFVAVAQGIVKGSVALALRLLAIALQLLALLARRVAPRLSSLVRRR